MDTRSYIYYIQTEDFYSDIKDDIKELFDTTNYLVSTGNLPLNINIKVIDMFRDETGDSELSHFVALRAKLYSYYCDNDINNTLNRCNEASKHAKNNDITFQNLYETLFFIRIEKINGSEISYVYFTRNKCSHGQKRQ